MRKRVFSIIRSILGYLAILIGVAIFLYPDISTCYQKYETGKYVEEFDDTLGTGLGYHPATGEAAGNTANNASDDASNEALDEALDDAKGEALEENTESLYQEILSYNQKLYEGGQAEFKDAWIITQSPISFTGMTDDRFGYVEIPAMDVTLPLYIGASSQNMAKGLAILGQTSIPIGGENTNSVIAGHRGYQGAPFLREIERLALGDQVIVTNLWDKLTYQVTNIDVIDPYNSQALRIQEGKDMLTLVTCHPYRSHGKYRYVVYCERADSGPVKEGGNKEGQEAADDFSSDDQDETGNKDSFMERGSSGDTITAQDGTVYSTSTKDIKLEQLFRRVSAGLILLMLFMTIIRKERKCE